MTSGQSTITPEAAIGVWDCVVIGAGPAGAMAARQTAGRGLSTLVVDRKSFPRSKVCGACLNHRALSMLRSAGLAHITRDCGGLPINHFLLRAYGRQMERELPNGVALSRAAFDSALIRSATEAGAVFLSQTSANVAPRSANGGYRVLRLTNARSASDTKRRERGWEVQARVVIAADGLAHPSLRSLSEFGERVSPRSRVGIGTTVDDFDVKWLRPGTIHMAVGRDGYAGLVRVEDGRLNIAAAVNPSFLKSQGNAASAFHAILREAEFPPADVSPSQWFGTPALSRSSKCVAHDRVFVVGDAAGYVEPFTGEGMTWALSGGQSVGEIAALAVTKDAIEATRQWQQTWGKLVYRRQKWCRRLAWLLRHPQVAKLGVAVVASYPALTNSIVNQLNSEPVEANG